MNEKGITPETFPFSSRIIIKFNLDKFIGHLTTFLSLPKGEGIFTAGVRGITPFSPLKIKYMHLLCPSSRGTPCILQIRKLLKLFCDTFNNYFCEVIALYIIFTLVNFVRFA